MKLCITLLSAALLSLNILAANPNFCPCENCKCTKEKHCGCMDENYRGTNVKGDSINSCRSKPGCCFGKRK